jgi:hypothetical protein
MGSALIHTDRSTAGHEANRDEYANAPKKEIGNVCYDVWLQGTENIPSANLTLYRRFLQPVSCGKAGKANPLHSWTGP